jgi:hypothetical protein
MGLPTAPVTLTPAQIAELNQQLSNMRHDVNNNLALMVAALELLRRRPEMAPKLIESLSAQPDKVTEQMTKFSVIFEGALGITREKTQAQPGH